MRQNGMTVTNVSNTDISTQIGLMQQSLSGLVTSFGEFKTQTRGELQEIRSFYSSLAEKFQEKQKTNWPLLISMFTAVCILVGAAWKISDLQTKNTTAPLETTVRLIAVNTETNARLSEHMSETNNKLRADLDANTARDSVSEDDRRKLNERMGKHDDHLAKLEADNQVITASLKEVETQFSASDEVRNLQFADIKRTEALLWNLSNGLKEYPTAPYYFPHVSNREGNK